MLFVAAEMGARRVWRAPRVASEGGWSGRWQGEAVVCVNERCASGACAVCEKRERVVCETGRATVRGESARTSIGEI